MSFPHTTNESTSLESSTSRGSSTSVGPSGYSGEYSAKHDSRGIHATLGDDVPNPFSLVAQPSGPGISQRLWRGMKTSIATLLVTAVLLGCVYFGKQFLLDQLVADFDKLDSKAKQTRLIQIASFGTAAVEPLVDRLVDPADEVSESAFVLLQRMQNDWITLQQDDAILAHRKLVTAIAISYGMQKSDKPAPESLTQPQIARGRELLNQTILEFASGSSGDEVSGNGDQGNRDANVSRQTGLLVQSANQLLQRMRLPVSSTNVADRSGTLPNRLSNSNISIEDRSGWTDWPRPSTSNRPSARDGNGSGSAQIVRSGGRPGFDDDGEGLKPVPRGVTVPLTQIVTPSRSSKVLAARRPIQPTRREPTVQMATHLAESPLTVLDDETVIRHLANPDALIAQQANAELVRRGFTAAQLEMAHAVAVAKPQDRIRLIDSLVHSSQLNSGPWLSMMLDDPDRHVRLHVVSTLAATIANRKDPAVTERLRRRLAREQDSHVATRLRKVLDLR